MRPCDVETSDDFRRYYTHGWVGLKLTKEGLTPGQCIGNEGKDMHFRTIMKAGTAPEEQVYMYGVNTQVLNWEKMKEMVSFGIPKVGMVPYNGEVIYGAMRAERNSNRGLNLDRVSWYDFNHWHLRRKYGSAIYTHGSLQLVWSVFNPDYKPFNITWQLLDDGESVGLPLSEDYALYTIPSAMVPLVAYKRWTIGYAPSAYEVVLSPTYLDYAAHLRLMCGNAITVRGQ